MDLRHHFSVWFRWRAVLAAGTVLAVILGIFVSFKPVFSGGHFDLKWRSKAVYTTNSRLFVTQPGFPWGRATLPGVVAGGGTAAPAPTDTQGKKDKNKVDFADPGRFSNLAIVYAYLAQSEQVRALITPQPAPDQISVVYQETSGGDALPLLQLATKADTPVAAQQLNFKAIAALRKYLDQQLSEAKAPAAQRVQLQTLNPPAIGTLSNGRTPTVSGIVFVLVLVGALLLVYVLENLYPRDAPRTTVVLEEHKRRPRAASGRGEPASPSAR